MADLTWLQAIDKVLRDAAPEALHTNEIASRIIDGGLKEVAGATPGATVSATLGEAIKKRGSLSPYEKAGPGRYRLRQPIDASRSSEPEAPEPEESRDIVTAFGVYWERDDVDWKATPLLRGEFQTDGVAKATMTPVDFSGQHGLYLLHDVREVIYVGRTTTGDLGKRLYDHTKDRLRGRWSRFSWFGFRPISEDGKLGEKLTQLPSGCDMDDLITAVEAILIEAFEPRQNRQRGARISAVEYRQVPDPTIEKKKIKSFVDNLADS